MTHPGAPLQAGFADPVLDAQRTFRQLLEAIAHPGQIMSLVPLDGLGPLQGATLSVALSLLDHETPLYLDQAARQPAVEQHLRFHCGCPLVDDPARAMFAILADPASLLPLERFNPGSDDYPHQGATLIVQVAALDEDDQGLCLRGPGIQGRRHLRISGAPDNLPLALASNHAQFPRGVDLLFCAGQQLAALPRTTQLEE